ncbi:hypothetical protein TREES_T100021488 [Tupaia chinensis]|uniref:Uncharacterized protein n=1 Tax=Tupaia chinensis TaxID=246437 RepID=L9KHX4_TUPCH|nr:hypothetical protein TREES_T100021488 [Tupaia chinensis]
MDDCVQRGDVSYSERPCFQYRLEGRDGAVTWRVGGGPGSLRPSSQKEKALEDSHCSDAKRGSVRVLESPEGSTSLSIAGDLQGVPADEVRFPPLGVGAAYEECAGWPRGEDVAIAASLSTLKKWEACLTAAPGVLQSTRFQVCEGADRKITE